MEIEIKQENYKQLVQCIYLGNLIINEYRKCGDEKKEFSLFMEDILKQIIKTANQESAKLVLKKISYEKTEDTMLADLLDRIEDSVKVFYEEYRNNLFCEILADKIADRNYPVVCNSEADAFDNLVAKNLYYELIKNSDGNYVHIDAPRISDKIKRVKREMR